MYQSLITLLKTLRTNSANSSAADTRHVDTIKKLTEGRVSVIVEPIRDGEYRVLLAPLHNAAKSNKYSAECGGIVLGYDGTWDVLALPPPPLKDKFERAELIANLDKYAIEHAIDGTMVTLYHYAERWRLSSTHGYDVTDLKWMGPKTYMEALLATVGGGFLERLQPNNCYTVVFKSPDFHPLEAACTRAVSITSVDLGRFNADYTYKTVENPLPAPEKYTPIKGLTAAERYKSLVNINGNSLRGLVKGEAAPRFGFILRPSDPALPTIFMRSALSAFLRENVYNVVNKDATNEMNRLELMILRAWLSYTTRFTLGYLMPARTRVAYKKYDELVKKITNYVIYPEDNVTLEAKFAANIARKLNDAGINVSPLDVAADSLIRDHLIDKKYAEQYLTMLEKNTTQSIWTATTKH